MFLDVLSNEHICERERSSEQRSALRQIRRWRHQYHVVTVEERPTHGKLESRILLNGKILLKTSEMRSAVHQSYKLTKGSGCKQVQKQAAIWFLSISSMTARSQMKHLKVCQKTRPVFDIRALLIHVPASAVQQRHQIDLVSMANYPVKRGKKRV